MGDGTVKGEERLSQRDGHMGEIFRCALYILSFRLSVILLEYIRIYHTSICISIWYYVSKDYFHVVLCRPFAVIYSLLLHFWLSHGCANKA